MGVSPSQEDHERHLVGILCGGSVSMSVYVSVWCVCVCLFVCISVSVSVSVSMHVCVYKCLFVYLSLGVSICAPKLFLEVCGLSDFTEEEGWMFPLQALWLCIPKQS